MSYKIGTWKYKNMKENDKYYTPRIEEFHMGFEYEREEPYTGEWTKCEDDGNTSPKHFEKYSEEFRVKHLDREDIESFGWEGDKMEAWRDLKDRFLYHKEVETERGKENLTLFHVPHTNWVLMYFNGEHFGGYALELPGYKLTISGNTVFAGVIKNKSELKRLLAQIVT